MTGAERLVLSTSARKWLDADAALRGTVLDALLEVLPGSFAPGMATGQEETALPFFIHQPSWLGFHLVFGERFVFGISEEEAAAAGGAPDTEDPYDAPEVPAPVLPRFEVDVAPYLLCERELDSVWLQRLGLPARLPSGSPEDITEALTRLGWRLPTEAELLLSWRLERTPQWQGRALGLCTGLATAVAAPTREGELPVAAPKHVSWEAVYTQGRQRRWGREEYFPVRLAPRWGTRWWRIRPAASLLPDGLACAAEAVEARRGGEPLR
ncbi:MAG: hypothetical protein AB1938_20410 [Myxococcota bacterium]